MFCLSRYLAHSQIKLGFRNYCLNVAVVGSGPAGFYTTQKLLKNQDVKVDIYEKLPVPFGLVRYGVAPDHADVKNVINSFTSVANNERVRFLGNVSLSQDVSLDELLDAYHAVVLCYGSAKDKMLNIEGEKESKNLISARNFVGWYNGVPEDKDLKVNVDCDTACIIGQGNVALDCARIIVNRSKFVNTDITSHAHKHLSSSNIKKVYIIGRRGPVQVSFSTKELRELISLNQNRIKFDPHNVFTRNNIDIARLKNLSRQRRRLTETLMSICPSEAVQGDDQSNDSQIIFKFFSKPYRIEQDKLILQKTEFTSLDEFMNEESQPEDVDEYESIECGLIIRSIGYNAVMLDKKLPYNHKLGAILNEEGRVQGYNNLYCSGWLATGASGVIAATLSSSHVAAKSILSDIDDNKLRNVSRVKPGFDRIGKMLKARNKKVISFSDWTRIDELEKRLGEILGKTREKVIDVEDMIKIAEK